MPKQSDKIIFHVFSRVKKGTANAVRLRKEGRVPGNIYGLKEESKAVLVDYQGLKKLYISQGDTGLIYLQVDEDKKQIPVLIDKVDNVIIGEGILHVSFKRVSLNVEIEVEVSVTLVGETKIDEAVVSQLKNTVLVKALPVDLPDNFEINISSLTEVGQSISLADLEFDKSKVTLVLEEGEDPSDILLINVQAVKEDEIVEEVEPEEIEGEEEGEAGTEGDSKEGEDGSEKSSTEDGGDTTEKTKNSSEK